MNVSLYMCVSMYVCLCACACACLCVCVWLVRCVSDIQVFCMSFFPCYVILFSSWDLKMQLHILVLLELLYLTCLVRPINPSIYISFLYI